MGGSGKQKSWSRRRQASLAIGQAVGHSPFCPASAEPTPPLSTRHLPYDDRGAEDGGGDTTGSRALDKGPAHEEDRVTVHEGPVKLKPISMCQAGSVAYLEREGKSCLSKRSNELWGGYIG